MIVSSRSYSTARPDVILMAITSQLRSAPGFGEVWIKEWQSANLLKASAVEPVIATVEQDLILKRLGVLESANLAALRAAIASILG